MGEIRERDKKRLSGYSASRIADRELRVTGSSGRDRSDNTRERGGCSEQNGARRGFAKACYVGKSIGYGGHANAGKDDGHSCECKCGNV